MASNPHKTPLHSAHLRLNARMVDFHGWLMPIQYAGVLEEHAAVRNRAGLFDLSHMGRVRITGKDRRAFLQNLLTVDVDRTEPGRCRYTFFLTERGTIIDDLILYAGTGPDEDRLVVNASNREQDLEWMRKHASGDVTIEDRTFAVALLAVQGPESPELVRKALGVDPSPLKYYTFGTFGDYFISRTGYTGEDGFEIFVPADRAESAWKAILEAGVPPIGLGARDTLRTEAAMPLYGNDMDDTTTPFDAGLKFAVEIDKPEFIGQAALRAEGPPKRKRAGMMLESKRIPRHGYEVYRGEEEVGVVSSGTWSPTLGKAIAMAYVPAEAAKPGTELEIDIRGRREKARVVKLPFYRRKKS